MKKLITLLFAASLASVFLTADSKLIREGTEIAIRTNEAIDSKNSSEGQLYTATIEKDVPDSSGTAILPKGSPAELIIRKVSSGSTLGSSQLTLDLHSVTVNGRRYTVQTQDLERSNRRGIGKNRRTAEMVGGGAALGTVIGAVAGGGKGAILGAILGAAGGATAQVLTKGKEVRVPAGTSLAEAIRAAGERTPANVLPTLAVQRVHGGALVPVEFDRTKQDILALPLRGGENIRW